MKKTGRSLDLDAAKGVAISLVVWGHIVSKDFVKPTGNDWYFVLNSRLYEFHMAFFFFLAGVVYFLSSDGDWWGRWKKTAQRLVPAYLLFAAIVFLLKGAAARFMPVNARVGGGWADVLLQFLYPSQGAAQYLWFIVVLLELQILVPWLLRFLPRKNLWLAFALSWIFHLMAINGYVTDLFALKWMFRYLPFFIAGALIVQYRPGFDALLDQWRWGFIVVFLVFMALAPKSVLPTVGAVLSVFALMALARYLCEKELAGWLIFLGVNSFTIYLMNSLAMGLARSIFVKTWGWDDWKFVPVVLALWLIGLSVPIFIQRKIFSRFRYLDRITR